MGNQGKWLAVAIMTPLILLFGEVLPKTIAVSKSEKFSLRVAQPLSIFATIIFPVRWIIRQVVDRITSLLGPHTKPDESIYHEEEFKELVEVGHQEGVLEKEEREMIQKILNFSDTLVASIMIPRAHMFTLPYDLDRTSLINEIKEHHFSRIPIYKQEKNNFVGVLYAKDLHAVSEAEAPSSTPVDNILRPPYLVPQDKKIPDLLKEFQDKRIHLALVVNEHGSVVGLVTMEDLLEELFGEIYDEFDDELNKEKQ
jgi:CBS domain containing-hemolysin-like protein